MTTQRVYTIGHSTHSIETFLSLLAAAEVNCVIDVRSVPFSRIAPHFSKPALRATLKEAQILYAHFAVEFGARHSEPALLDNDGRVDFDKLRAAPPFQQGIERLRNALEMGYRVALMCSEGNPFDCHRFSLVSYGLVHAGFTVEHILPDGEVIPNQTLELKLLEKYARKLPVSTLFETVTDEMRLEHAYRLRGRAVAYRAGQPGEEEEQIPDE